MAKSKSVVMTFRVDAHLAQALEGLPDRSAFIRRAIESALHEPCPACGGKGVVACDSATWLRGLLDDNGAQVCQCCSVAFDGDAPRDASRVAGTDGEEADGVSAPVCGHCGPDGHVH